MRSRRTAGFTLVEAVLAIVVIAAISLGVAEMMTVGLDSYGLVVDRREALQRARLAMNLMTGELQSIANPATDIAAIGATSITFTSGGNSITYAVSGNRLTRQDANGTSILAENVLPVTRFDFFTQGGAVTANRALVHRIHITIGVDTGVARHGTVVMNSNVYLRNRYYGSFTQQ